jgi:hypothetical protein
VSKGYHLTFEDLKDIKFAQRDVFDFDIYDQDYNLITTFNTVNADEFLYVNGRVFLKIKNQIIDKPFLDYINEHDKFNCYIEGRSFVRKLDYEDIPIDLEIQNAKLLYAKYVVSVEEAATATLFFEIFENQDRKKINIDLDL